MTLLGVMYTLERDQQIQINSRGGTGNWFAGTVEEYLELWKELDTMTETAAKRSVQSARRTWKSRQTWMEWNEYVSYHTARAHNGQKPKMDYDKYVKDAKHKRDNAKVRYEERKKWYDEYEKPSQRKVVDSYRSLLRPEVIIIAVKGREWGGFWNYDERDPEGVPYSFGTANIKGK